MQYVSWADLIVSLGSLQLSFNILSCLFVYFCSGLLNNHTRPEPPNCQGSMAVQLKTAKAWSKAVKPSQGQKENVIVSQISGGTKTIKNKSQTA